MGCRILAPIAAAAFGFLSFLSSVHSFYLPGVAPRDFQQGDELPVKVNKLSSTKTQLPYDFYYLKYCKPKNIKNVAQNLGEVLRGDRIENSVYTFHMREDQSCAVACKTTLDEQDAKNFKEKIDDEYRANIVMYHKDPETESARIVGFEVSPTSINHEIKEWDENNPKVTTCSPNPKNLIQGGTAPQEVVASKDFVFSYDVTFRDSNIKWASRWDTYLLMNDDQIH